MPNIRDLGISSIPATARPMEADDGAVRNFADNPVTSPPLCECDPTSRPGCQPTNRPGCQPTNRPGCQPTNQPPGCNPTEPPSTCDPTSMPGCQPTNQHRGRSDGEYSVIPPDAVAQLKRQLQHHISTEVRN